MSQSYKCLGFEFTEIEEIAMRRACRKAEKFMEKYGKGDKPGVRIKGKDYFLGIKDNDK